MKSQLSVNGSGFLQNPKTFLMFNLVSKLWMFSRMFGSFISQSPSNSLAWFTSSWGIRLSLMAYKGFAVVRPTSQPFQRLRTQRPHLYKSYRLMRDSSLNKLSLAFKKARSRSRVLTLRSAKLVYRMGAHPYFFDTRPFQDRVFSIVGAPYRRRFRLPRRVLMFPHYSMRLTRYETISGSGRTRRWAYRRWLVDFLQEQGVGVEHGVSMFVAGNHRAPRPAWFKPYGFATTLMGAADAKQVRLIPTTGFSFLATQFRRRMCRKSRSRRRPRSRSRYTTGRVFSGVALRQFRSRLGGHKNSVREVLSELRAEVSTTVGGTTKFDSLNFLIQRPQLWLVGKGIRKARVAEFGIDSRGSTRLWQSGLSNWPGLVTGRAPTALVPSKRRRRRRRGAWVERGVSYINRLPRAEGGDTDRKVAKPSVRKRARRLFRSRLRAFKVLFFGEEVKPSRRVRRKRRPRRRRKSLRVLYNLVRRPAGYREKKRQGRLMRLFVSSEGKASAGLFNAAHSPALSNSRPSHLMGVLGGTRPSELRGLRGLAPRRRLIRRVYGFGVRYTRGLILPHLVTLLLNAPKVKKEFRGMGSGLRNYYMLRMLKRLSLFRKVRSLRRFTDVLRQSFPTARRNRDLVVVLRTSVGLASRVVGFRSYRHSRSLSTRMELGFVTNRAQNLPLSALIPNSVRSVLGVVLGGTAALRRWISKPSSPEVFHTIKSPFNLPLIFGVHGFMYISTSNRRTRHQVREITYTLYSFSSDVQTRRYLLRYFSPTRVQFDSLLALSGAVERRFKSYNSPSLGGVNSEVGNFSSILHARTRLTLPSGFNVVNKLTSRVLGTGKPDRIQFKPGYSRMWRRARTSLQVSLGLTLRYQYRLTRLLLTMYRTSKIGTFRRAETRLASVLVRSALAAEESHADLLVESGSVFINGSQVCNGVTALFTNDFVQLVVNVKYYMAYRHVLTSLIDKHRRVAKLARYKYSPTSWQVQKQRSKRVPLWVQGIRFSREDVPKYLEVDYFTLSIFMLYDPFLLSDFSPFNNFDSRDRVINMYNWKYIN